MSCNCGKTEFEMILDDLEIGSGGFLPVDRPGKSELFGPSDQQHTAVVPRVPSA